MKKFAAVTAVATCLVAGSAYATSVHVDFTDPVWSAAEGRKGYYVPYADLGITVFVRAWNYFDLTVEQNGMITWNGGDGLGVGPDDEIGGTEYLKVMFFEGLYVYGENPLPTVEGDDDYFTLQLDKIELLDLFQNEGPDDADEMAFVRGQDFSLNLANSTNDPLGFFSYTFDPPSITNLVRFYGSTERIGGSYDGFSDYAVAGLWLTAEPVPEPATFLLFGAGLAGIIGTCKRRRK